MRPSKPGWANILRHHRSDYLAWIHTNDVLQDKFDILASSLWSLLQKVICTPEEARAVWNATPAVLSHCNEQATYEMPGAAAAYAWLHLLDRYVRTWCALEKLVIAGCLPLAKHGIRALDVGTGPGPSAFAIHDFYSAMTEFAIQTDNLRWRQTPAITCVEYDPSTNHLRHNLAEEIFEYSKHQHREVFAMSHSLSDFRAIMPSAERKHLQKRLQWVEDEYFDEIANEWISGLRYTADDASDIAQALHRYRLVVFSNFLTTVDTVTVFEPNLIDILSDAQPGAVVILLGGKGGDYPDIYEYVNRLAIQTGFEPEIAGEKVSSVDTAVAERIYSEGVRVYTYLQCLSPDASEEIQRVHSHFGGSREPFPVSQLWAYRKHRRMRTT